MEFERAASDSSGLDVLGQLLGSQQAGQQLGLRGQGPEHHADRHVVIGVGHAPHANRPGIAPSIRFPAAGNGKARHRGISGAGLCLGGYCVAAFCGVFCCSSPSFMPFVSGRSQNVISVITPREIA